ncbi:WecB/TagA/CpsF family glycosyltransferase [Methylophaga sp.]|uniref:WecB/TagA/CpsF family glycosyltransferase n=1 Tax=Methylophaga sp. TaxID=2024840 RepID=UPI003F711462
MGLPFDAVSLKEAAAIISESIEQQTPCFVSTPNLNFTVMAQNDTEFYNSVIESDLVVADGMPLIWVAKLLNLPIEERVAGSDLFAYLSDQPRERKIRVFFFGGESGIAEKAHHELNKTSPGMESCGFYDPGFVSIEAMSQESIIEHINACAPDFIVVALGAKKGQRWIVQNRDSLNAPVISHLGAVINFVAGSVQRAPEKWQRFGIEWLWRIKQEPKLYKRYFGDGLRFIQMLLTQTLPLSIYRKKLERNIDPSNSEVLADTLPHHEDFMLSLKGNISAEQLPELDSAFKTALEKNKNIIIDGEDIQNVSMDVLARIMIYQGKLRNCNKQMFLKDFPDKIVTLLRLSGVLPRFRLIWTNK